MGSLSRTLIAGGSCVTGLPTPPAELHRPLSFTPRRSEVVYSAREPACGDSAYYAVQYVDVFAGDTAGAREAGFRPLADIFEDPPCGTAPVIWPITAGELHGKVLNRGQPLPATRIRIRRGESGPDRDVVTDATGRFRIDRVEPGMHAVMVARIGMRRWQRAVRLREQPGDVEIELCAAAFG